jgi:hypothetical protein
MDLFGIGQAVKGAVSIYFRSARGGGRTISMVESVKDGDRICFTNRKEADRVSKLCQERNVSVECIVIHPHMPEKLFERGSSIGRTIFDHSWVEEYYLHAIEQCARSIDHFERETSGYGEAHRKTRRAAIESSKWVI